MSNTHHPPNTISSLNLLLPFLLLFLPFTHSTNSIPRSTRHTPTSHGLSSHPSNHSTPFTPPLYPPWNPSKRINDEGFVTSLYPLLPGTWEDDADLTGKYSGPKSRQTLPHQYAQIRQVPGDGNCLFHALSTTLAYAVNGTHADLRNATWLYHHSAVLRGLAVECLRRKPRKWLCLQGEECLRAKDLVDAAASQYNMTGEQYCALMKKDSYWGGGPEIVALCNVLRRPIHVYELTEDLLPQDASATSSSSDDPSPSLVPRRRPPPGFRLRRMACFGSPKFDRKEPLHILSADSRFPDVAPGRQLASGNHFLAMFPIPIPKTKKSSNRSKNRQRERNEKVRMRGGNRKSNTSQNSKSDSNHSKSKSGGR